MVETQNLHKRKTTKKGKAKRNLEPITPWSLGTKSTALKEWERMRKKSQAPLAQFLHVWQQQCGGQRP